MLRAARQRGRLALATAIAFACLELLGGCMTQGMSVATLHAPVAVPALERIADATHLAGFNGIAVVASRDRVFLEKAFGPLSPASALPLQADSVFRLASISKQVTAILVMQEVSKGTLALDVPLGRYWPEYPNDDARAVSLRQLLMHTSGLPNPDKVDNFYESTRVMDSHMRASAETACAAPLQRKPGDAFEYNNCDYLVLGTLLERVNKTSFAALLTTRIFDPAGVIGAGIYARQTQGIDLHAQGTIDGKSDGTINPVVYAAAGGLYGTVRDIWQLNRAFTDGRLLNEAARQIMTTPNQWGAALGVWVYELNAVSGVRAKVVERQGWVGGIRVVNLLDMSSGISVVVMSTNGDYDLSQSWSGKGIAAELLLAAISSPP